MYVMNNFPPPPGAGPSPAPDATRLTENETDIIIRTTLLPHHRSDPNVLAFIQHYLRHRNATRAARDIGLAPHAGGHLKNRPDIYNCIMRLTEKQAMKHGFDASEVMEKVKEIVNVDLIDFVNPDGSYREIHEIPEEARGAIKKFKAYNKYETDPNGMRVLVGRIIEVELHDKIKPIELMGREKDLFSEKKKVTHDIGSNMASMLLESKQRAQEHSAKFIQPRDVIEITGKVSDEKK